MPAIATDDFNRANDVTLGANWTFPYSANPTIFRIVSNQCKSPSGSGTRGIFWNASSFNDDQYAKVTLIAVGGSLNSGWGAAVRCAGTAGGDDFNGYTFWADGAAWKLSRQDAGVATDLATGSAAFASNDIIEIRVAGTTITGYKNGVAVSGATATDATYASGKAGMVVYNSGAFDPICDDWEGGNIVVDVSVNLTGVAADPQIGVGTVEIGSVVVEPPAVGPGGGTGRPARTGMRLRPTEDKFVYLKGVAANPQVGEVRLLSEMRQVYQKYVALIRRVEAQKAPKMPAGMRGLFKKVEKPVPPAVFVYQASFPKLKSAIGTGKVKMFYEDSDEELYSTLKMMDVDEDVIAALKFK